MNLKTAINMRIYNARVMWERLAPIWLENLVNKIKIPVLLITILMVVFYALPTLLIEKLTEYGASENATLFMFIMFMIGLIELIDYLNDRY